MKRDARDSKPQSGVLIGLKFTMSGPFTYVSNDGLSSSTFFLLDEASPYEILAFWLKAVSLVGPVVS